MSEFKLGKWRVMHKTLRYGDADMRGAFTNKEDAVALLNEIVNDQANDDTFKPGNSFAIQLDEDSYIIKQKFGPEWFYQWIWIQEQDEKPDWLQQLENENMAKLSSFKPDLDNLIRLQ